MGNFPLVSVIIPCYNHEKYVKESILSVLNQTYKNVQLIVIDDGSKDKSIEIIKELKQTHDFIFEAQANIGLSATLNKAINKYCSGDYISVVASDDFWHVEKLVAQIKYFNNHPNVGMVFSKAFIVDSKSIIVDKFSNDRFKEFCTFEDLILDRKGIPALTVIVKKEVFKKVGLYDENLLIEDWDMWLRIANEYNIGYVEKELAYYRIHPTNTSSKLELMMDERLKILNKWKDIKPAVYKKALLYWQLFALRTFVIENKTVAKKFLHISNDAYLKSKYYKLLFKYYFK